MPPDPLKVTAYGAHLRAFGIQVWLFQLGNGHFKTLSRTRWLTGKTWPGTRLIRMSRDHHHAE